MTEYRHPVARLAYRLGFHLRRVRPLAVPELSEELFPTATYAPWKGDARFLETFQAVQGATMLTRHHCWILWQLIEQVAKTPGCLIEVGVWRGGSGALMASRARQCGIADRAYLCDTFRGIVKARPEETAYPNGKFAVSRAPAEQLIATLGLEKVSVLEGVFPDVTGPQVTDSHVRFCHVDVDVYDSARDVFEWVWGRMSVGGVLVFDDYGDMNTRGVIRYAEEIRMRPDLIFVHSLAGQAIFVKTAASAI